MNANLTIQVIDNDITRALRDLKKRMMTTGLEREFKERARGYLKPGERRRLKSKIARTKRRKAAKIWAARDVDPATRG